MDDRIKQAILEAQDRIDNDGRDTREVLDWLIAQVTKANRGVEDGLSVRQ